MGMPRTQALIRELGLGTVDFDGHSLSLYRDGEFLTSISFWDLFDLTDDELVERIRKLVTIPSIPDSVQQVL